MQSKNRYDHRLAYKKSSAPAHKDELQTYLDAPTEECPNPIAWWWERRALYPHLSQMALAYLSIPGTSF